MEYFASNLFASNLSSWTKSSKSFSTDWMGPSITMFRPPEARQRQTWLSFAWSYCQHIQFFCLGSLLPSFIQIPQEVQVLNSIHYEFFFPKVNIYCLNMQRCPKLCFRSKNESPPANILLKIGSISLQTYKELTVCWLELDILVLLSFSFKTWMESDSKKYLKCCFKDD